MVQTRFKHDASLVVFANKNTDPETGKVPWKEKEEELRDMFYDDEKKQYWTPEQVANQWRNRVCKIVKRNPKLCNYTRNIKEIE